MRNLPHYSVATVSTPTVLSHIERFVLCLHRLLLPQHRVCIYGTRSHTSCAPDSCEHRHTHSLYRRYYFNHERCTNYSRVYVIKQNEPVSNRTHSKKVLLRRKKSREQQSSFRSPPLRQWTCILSTPALAGVATNHTRFSHLIIWPIMMIHSRHALSFPSSRHEVHLYSPMYHLYTGSAYHSTLTATRYPLMLHTTYIYIYTYTCDHSSFCMHLTNIQVPPPHSQSVVTHP